SFAVLPTFAILPAPLAAARFLRVRAAFFHSGREADHVVRPSDPWHPDVCDVSRSDEGRRLATRNDRRALVMLFLLGVVVGDPRAVHSRRAAAQSLDRDA